MPAGLLLLPIGLGLFLTTIFLFEPCDTNRNRAFFYLIPFGFIVWGLSGLSSLFNVSVNPPIIIYYHTQNVNGVDLIADEDGDVINLNRKLGKDIPDDSTIKCIKYTNNVLGLNFGASYEYFIESDRKTETVQ